MGLIENVKAISELVKKYNDLELLERIVELREEIVQIREENVALRERVKSIDETEAIRNSIVRYGNCYYRTDDTEKKHPFCMACWDYDRKLVGLIKGAMHGGGFSISCDICRGRRSSKSS